jgi:osmoprotectant transport system permease protein
LSDLDTADQPEAEQVSARQRRRRAEGTLPGWAGYLLTPLVVAAGLLLLYLYMSRRELGGIERRVLNYPVISRRMVEHLDISFWATLLVLGSAIPVGIALTRPWARRITPYMVGLANIGQGVPSIGTMVLAFLILTRSGRSAAIVGLAVYAFLPVLRGTMVGLEQVPREMIKAARGMGMSRVQVLQRIELPLSVPILLTGVRTALVLTVSTAPLAAFVGGGTLGALITTGFAQSRFTLVVTGSVLAAALALLADWAGGVAEDRLRPRGL